ncbi:O-antigen ligase family protein [Geomonas oryzisoli]|uniref:O-antigen ligase family protein n=1 Tax=Geomonas oryzisoli TaxID=2847992 RepID=A0ABX8J296_9BACT|nr:O-antigen ligase family protein [Geomonas oryzisoli]QWV91843.1 O-antigen ligase family protein [Geomonas oryzisoli]
MEAVKSAATTVDFPDAGGDLKNLELRSLLAFVRRQDLLFWAVNLYLFFEYIRPQTLYPVLDVMPYAAVAIVVSMLLLVLTKKNFVRNPAGKLFFLLLVVIFSSSIMGLSTETSLSKIYIVISWFLVYLLIANAFDTEDSFLLMMLVFLVYNFKMAQFAFRGWASIGFGFGKDGTGGGPGWFANSGEFGIEMCIFFSLSAYFFLSLRKGWPRWKQWFFGLFPAAALAGIISSSSRGAVLGALSVVCLMLFQSSRKWRALFLVALLVVVAYSVVPAEQLGRFSAVGTDATSINRMARWDKGLEMVKMYPFLGVGYANWAAADMRFFGGNGDLCHNIFIECASELGYLGLAAFLSLVFITFKNNHDTRKMVKGTEDSAFITGMAHGLDCALVGYLVTGFFVTVMYYPYFWVNLGMTVALNSAARKKIKA